MNEWNNLIISYRNHGKNGQIYIAKKDLNINDRKYKNWKYDNLKKNLWKEISQIKSKDLSFGIHIDHTKTKNRNSNQKL